MSMCGNFTLILISKAGNSDLSLNSKMKNCKRTYRTLSSLGCQVSRNNLQ